MDELEPRLVLHCPECESIFEADAVDDVNHDQCPDCGLYVSFVHDYQTESVEALTELWEECADREDDSESDSELSS